MSSVPNGYYIVTFLLLLLLFRPPAPASPPPSLIIISLLAAAAATTSVHRLQSVIVTMLNGLVSVIRDSLCANAETAVCALSFVSLI